MPRSGKRQGQGRESIKRPTRILQLGDIHYPDSSNERPTIDIKDASFPVAVSRKLGVQPLASVTRHLQQMLQTEDFDSLALMGDLTSRGDHAGYSKCVKYLKDAIVSNFWHPRPVEKILIAPGNHDISRGDWDPADMYVKFKKLKDILIENGMPTIPVEMPVRLSIEHPPSSKVVVYCINTCLGCGERRYMPPFMREQFFNKIDSELEANTEDPARFRGLLEQIYEQLDTPAVGEHVIAHICAELATSSDVDVNVIIGHHNLLPQALPRVDFYTEMLNSGQLRSGLLQSCKPIIFLHGHVHDTPIETIASPVFRHSSIISISAPLLSMGYNVVEIHHSDAGYPLGCLIRCFRHGNFGQVHELSQVRVPLWLNPGVKMLLSAEASSLLDQVNSKRVCYQSELELHWFEGHDPTPALKQKFVSALDELLWKGLVSVESQGPDPRMCRITRAT
jgi:hypothetical protein